MEVPFKQPPSNLKQKIDSGLKGTVTLLNLLIFISPILLVIFSKNSVEVLYGPAGLELNKQWGVLPILPICIVQYFFFKVAMKRFYNSNPLVKFTHGVLFSISWRFLGTCLIANLLVGWLVVYLLGR